MSSQKKKTSTNPSKRVTLKHIAAKCGVCVMTVSCALRGDRKMVSEKTIERIRKIAQEMGYRYDLGHSARRLKYTASDTNIINHLIAMDIGLDAMTSPYFTRIVSVISKELYKVDFSILTGWQGQVTSKQVPLVFKRGDVDGVFNMAGVQSSQQMLKALRAEPGFGDRPVVSMLEPLEDCPAVLCDEQSTALEVAEYLYSMGHRKILVPKGSMISYQGRQRLEKMKAFFQGKGIRGRESFVMFDYHMQMGTKATWNSFHKALGKHPDATAIFAGNDLVAVRICEALRLNGVRVPDDMSIIGHDDTHVIPGEKSDNILTTIHLPLEDVAFEATHMLLDLIHGKQVSPKTVVLSTKLIVRDSVRRIEK